MEPIQQTVIHHEAERMLRTFVSVGVETFDLTVTNREGEKIRFQRARTVESLSRALPSLLHEAAVWECNVIIRPRTPRPVLLQLDDLPEDTIQQLQTVSFLSLRTSPGNHQAWIAVSEPLDKDFARKLIKHIGADVSASGAARIAGSYNFKDKYAPDFPSVEIIRSMPGRITHRSDLEALGIPGALQPPPHTRKRTPLPHTCEMRWPSYERCLQGAPLNNNQTGPDISRVDFTFCLTAIDWGWSIEATALRLMEMSSKAKENGSRYAFLTSLRAAEALNRRRGTS